MSSLESHTIVPTLTMLGRVSEWIRLLSMAEAAVTGSLLPRDQACVPRGVESGKRRRPVGPDLGCPAGPKCPHRPPRPGILRDRRGCNKDHRGGCGEWTATRRGTAG